MMLLRFLVHFLSGICITSFRPSRTITAADANYATRARLTSTRRPARSTSACPTADGPGATPLRKPPRRREAPQTPLSQQPPQQPPQRPHQQPHQTPLAWSRGGVRAAAALPHGTRPLPRPRESAMRSMRARMHARTRARTSQPAGECPSMKAGCARAVHDRPLRWLRPSHRR